MKYTIEVNSGKHLTDVRLYTNNYRYDWSTGTKDVAVALQELLEDKNVQLFLLDPVKSYEFWFEKSTT